jgi:hypothetical protein
MNLFPEQISQSEMSFWDLVRFQVTSFNRQTSPDLTSIPLANAACLFGIYENISMCLQNLKFITICDRLETRDTEMRRDD